VCCGFVELVNVQWRAEGEGEHGDVQPSASFWADCSSFQPGKSLLGFQRELRGLL
jgi:hypothetical protein